jgi:PAS domain S-box-containing protein
MDDRFSEFWPTGSAQLNLLMRAVESARNGIIVTDPKRADNPIIYANPGFTELTGFRLDQIIGRNCRFLQRDDRDQAALEVIREGIRLAQPVTAVVRNYKKNGRLFWNELTVSPVYDDSGELTNFVGIQNDVTARIEAETRVSEFYSMISHELKTPLASIYGALTGLADNKMNAQSRKLLAIALNNSEKLQRLIDDILDWKKLESGKFKLVKRELKAADVVTEVIEDHQTMAAAAGVSLRQSVESQTELIGDVARLQQALGNLVSNAIKYSASGQEVLVSARDTASDAVRFAVTDQGQGISLSEQDKLFVHFQQLESPDRRVKAGTGLGLAIAKSIVELHGGHIGVDSELGRGSTFWFELFTQNSNLQ